MLCFSVIRYYWQTRTHCCGHIVADTNVSPFARARNICCGHKFCVRGHKNVPDFVQKHFVSAENVSQFARARKHHEQQCVRNNVSSFASTFISRFEPSNSFAGFAANWLASHQMGLQIRCVPFAVFDRYLKCPQ